MGGSTNGNRGGRLRRAVLGGALLVGLLVATHPNTAIAEASADNRAAAEALFQEAGRLFKDGKYAEACSKLQDSNRLDPAAGTLMNLGRCYEKVGMTASAWLAYLDAASVSKRTGQSDRERSARDSASKLAPGLAKLTVQVPSAALVPSLEVKRDGDPLPKTLLNMAAPIDPGDHEISCSAQGKKPWTTRIHIDPSQGVTVVVPRLEDAPVAAASGPRERKAPTDPGGTVGTGGKQGDQESKGLGTTRALALVAGGLGLAGVAVGTVFGLGAMSDRDATNQNNRCTEGGCTPEGIDFNNKAHDKAMVSTVGFAVGGAALATGLVLWMVGSPRSRTEQRTGWRSVDVALSPPLGDRGGGLLVKGIW